MATRLAQLLSNSFWRLMEQVEDGLDVWGPFDDDDVEPLARAPG